MAEKLSEKTTCDKLIKFGVLLLIGYLLYKWWEKKQDDSRSANEVAEDNFSQQLSDLRQRYVNRVTDTGLVILPDGAKFSTNAPVVLKPATTMVDGDSEVEKHFNLVKTKGSRTLLPFQRGRKFRLVGSRKPVSEGMVDYEKRAEALLPKNDDNLSEVEKKWVGKAHLPSLQQIKDAQYVQQEAFFNQIPIKNRRIAASTHRVALQKPSPPELLFDQPIID